MSIKDMTPSKEAILKLALRHKLQKDNKKPEDKLVIQNNIEYGEYEKYCQFENYAKHKLLQSKKKFIENLNVAYPFFISHDNVGSATTTIGNKQYINFSSYNYLNLNGDPRVSEAAKNAIDQYGTSCSASRLVAGERPIHGALESAIAAFYETEDAVAFVSGHATNISTIRCLFDSKDLILHDQFIHDSILQGIHLSGAARISFPHNDWETLENILDKNRHNFERVLIVIEGLYSMDGDFPDLPKFIELKKKYKTFLMIDEAHSLGALGKNGRGIGEQFGIDFKDVDIWMGTLSKTLAGCGGYIAGSHALIEQLKYGAPGFVYSVGISPVLAAASLRALEIMQTETHRVSQLQARGYQFLQAAREAGLNVGLSKGYNVIPIIYGNSKKAIQKSSALLALGVNVQPIIYPAVSDNHARLRFFISCAHTEEQITFAVNKLLEIE